jgi:DNA-binding response OmpR family regulator
MMLTEFGYTVIQAEDGSDAVRKFREHESEITLAILDVVMPRMDGKEVRDELLKINPAVKVLYVSGYNADILRAKGITEGTANIILKPVSPMDLLHAVRLALDSNDRRRPGKSGVA